MLAFVRLLISSSVQFYDWNTLNIPLWQSWNCTLNAPFAFVMGYCYFVGRKCYLLPHEFFSQMNNTILAILHTLNILAFVIEIATKSAVRVIALAIVLGEYTWTGAQVLYNNRQDILENANIFRNRIGSYFAYAWLVTTICATCFSGTYIYHWSKFRVL